MYTFDSRIRYTESDFNEKLTLASLIDYFQDCTNFHTKDLGMDFAWHQDKGVMWVLNFWQIVIKQWPKMGDEVTIGTQSTGCEKMFGHRNFVMSKQGALQEQFVVANSLWVLVDTKKGRPMLVPEDMKEAYGAQEPLEMEYASRKIAIPKEDGEIGESILVCEHHLDSNRHVNNGQYVRMALAYLEDESKVKELRVEYKIQALLGDEITPVVYKQKDECIVVLQNNKNKAYAVVQFIM